MLPSELQYTLPPSIPQGWKSDQLRVQTISTYPTSVVQGTEFQIQIPQLPNTFLDPTTSYLNVRATFKWKNAAGQTASLSDPAENPLLLGSGWSLFQRYELYFNNSNLLDQIMYPGVYVNAMLNSTMTPNQRIGCPNMGFGDSTGHLPNYATTLSTDDGVQRASGNGADGVTRTCTVDFAIPLIGVIGHATDKLIPLMLGGMRVDLTCDNITNYLKSGSKAFSETPEIVINNLEFVSNVVTVDAGSLAAVIQAHPEKLFIRTQSVVHSSQTIQEGSAAGLYELLISSRVSSQKALVICPSTSLAYEGLYSGVNPNLTAGTSVSINNTFFPKATHDPYLRPMDVFATNKIALNSLYSANHAGSISRREFVSASTANSQFFATSEGRGRANAFYWIQSTEVFGRKASLLSGVDTKAGSNFLRCVIGTSLGATSGVFTMNMFSVHDVILECDLQSRQIIRRI